MGLIMRWTLVFHFLLFAEPLCFGQDSGTIQTIQHTTLPIIITGKPDSAATAQDKKSPTGRLALIQIKGTKDCEPADVVENLVSFAPESLRLAWVNQNWQLRDGDVVLKDFGHREELARHTLMLIRQLRLDQYGTVGQPKPVLEYWLAQGKAPQGNPMGLPVMTLDQAGLRAEQTYGQWCVRDTYRMLLNFGRDEGSARQAVAILKRHQFSRVGSLATMPPTLIFLRQPGDEMQLARYSAVTVSRPNLQTSGAVLSTVSPSLTGRPQQPGVLNGSNGLSSPQTLGSQR